MATYKELKARAEELSVRIELARRAELQPVIEEVRATVREYGLTSHDVFGYCVNIEQSKSRRVQPKYRDPGTGATWSGRGIAPRWIRGRDRKEFLIG